MYKDIKNSLDGSKTRYKTQLKVVRIKNFKVWKNKDMFPWTKHVETVRRIEKK